MSRRLIIGILFLAILFAGRTTGSALAAVDGLPVVPDPAECTVTPRTTDELAALISATPVSASASPAAGSANFTLPKGTAGTDEQVSTIVDTMRQALACLNANDYLRFYSFASERLLTEQFGGEAIGEEEAAYLNATPVAVPTNEQVTLVNVREVTELADGSIGALVDTIFPTETPDVQTDYFQFISEDGTWVIDQIVEDLEGQYPPEATPTS